MSGERATHRYALRVTWTGASDGDTSSYENYNRAHTIESAGKPALRGSADPVFRGDAGAYSPEDLLVAALSACHMLSYLALCARAGIGVVSYVDDAHGTMSFHNGKMRFTEVVLQPIVTIGIGDVGKALALHERAHESCYIASSVNFDVRHEASVDAYVADQAARNGAG